MAKKFQDLLNETTLSRVFRHLTGDRPVAIMTAFRDRYTLDQNQSRNRELARKIRSAGYGFVFVDGAWIEDGKHVEEDSLFIIGDIPDNGKLKGLVREWIKTYDQDAAVFKPEGEPTAILINNDMSEVSLGRIGPDKIADIYTRLRGRGGRSFVFESVRETGGWAGALVQSVQEKEDH